MQEHLKLESDALHGRPRLLPSSLLGIMMTMLLHDNHVRKS